MADATLQNKNEDAPVQADKKYGQLSADIVNFLSELEYTNFREDKPVPFCGLLVYPAVVRDFEVFSNCTSCLTLNKNETVEGLRMSHLDYLIAKTQDPKEGGMWSYKLQKLFEMVFHIQNGLKCKKCGKVITYNSPEFKKFMDDVCATIEQEKQPQNNTTEKIETPSLHCPECDGTDFIEMIKIVQDPKTKKHSLMVDGHEISSRDFNKLRQLILYQNFYDYVDDSWVDPDVKKDHDEKMRLEQQKNDVHASIEKKVVCLSITTNYKFEEIYNMPIRRFTLALATVDDLINYKIMKQSVMSGFVSLPKGKTIEHWIYKPDKDMYGDSYKSTDEVHSAASNL